MSDDLEDRIITAICEYLDQAPPARYYVELIGVDIDAETGEDLAVVSISRQVGRGLFGLFGRKMVVDGVVELALPE